MAINFSKEGLDVSSVGQDIGRGLKNIYQGKTAEEIKKMKEEQARKDAKVLQDREDAKDNAKKDFKPEPPRPGGQLEKALKRAEEPRNSEGYTAAEEKDYLKKMKENEDRVKKMDELSKISNAGRLAEAAKKVKIKVRN